jgi:hypothetical protein
VPAATIWPGAVVFAGGEAVLRRAGDDLVRVAAEHRAHAGRGDGCGRGHRRPRSRTKTIACSAVITPAPRPR